MGCFVVLLKKSIREENMDKRYQVFISSTFADLEEERKGVMEAIIELDCFPAGMEMFPASNKEQFEYIRSIIDESDYYIIIVAGRYGSVAEDGISYTEKEFDYAKEKGIPILAFIKKDIETLPANKVEKDPDKSEKLEDFRNKVLTGRLAKFWNTPEELKYNLHSSLAREMRINPRIGWIRGDSTADIKLNQKLSKLQEENRLLKEKYRDSQKAYQDLEFNKKSDNTNEFLEKIHKKFDITFKNYNSTLLKETTSIYDILQNAGMKLIYGFNRDILEDCLKTIFRKENTVIREYDIETIIMKLMALELIEVDGFEEDDPIEMTQLGKETILKTVEF